MKKQLALVSFFLFLVFSPILFVYGSSYRLWQLDNLTPFLEHIPENFLFPLIFSVWTVFTPVECVVGKTEELLHYQYPLITYLFTVIATLIYCFILSHLILFLYHSITSLVQKKSQS